MERSFISGSSMNRGCRSSRPGSGVAVIRSAYALARKQGEQTATFNYLSHQAIYILTLPAKDFTKRCGRLLRLIPFSLTARGHEPVFAKIQNAKTVAHDQIIIFSQPGLSRLGQVDVPISWKMLFQACWRFCLGSISSRLVHYPSCERRSPRSRNVRRRI